MGGMKQDARCCPLLQKLRANSLNPQTLLQSAAYVYRVTQQRRGFGSLMGSFLYGLDILSDCDHWANRTGAGAQRRNWTRGFGQSHALDDFSYGATHGSFNIL